MPKSRQVIRSEETQKAILAAAGQLFAEKGFDLVTMREIAKLAGCSHTTIYIYFKDKETLLYQLSMEPLQSLHHKMETLLSDASATADDKLKCISREFIQFCLLNRNMYSVFFLMRATRVDDEEAALEVNKQRNRLFGLLKNAIHKCLDGETEEKVLAYSRIYFFTLQGIVGTYTNSAEQVDNLMERLTPTFDLAVDVMIAGFKQTSSK